MALASDKVDLTQELGQKPVLLLHGLGVYGESWWHQIQMLKQYGFNPIAPDLPGFGSTPCLTERWTVRRAAASVITGLDDRSVGQTVVCGLSMGGAVALQLAIDYPDRVSGLILINTFSALRPASVSEAVYFLRRGVKAYLRSPGDQAELVADRVFPSEEHAEWRRRLIDSIRASDPKVYKQAMIALARFDANQHLTEINTPVLVITGACDTTIPPNVQKRMAQKIPHADYQVIDGAGHGVIIDHYQEVNRLILNFVNRIYEKNE